MSSFVSNPAPIAIRYTASGARIDVLNPDPADLRIEDIAAHLANMNRFGGAVAEHCCLGTQFVLDPQQFVSGAMDVTRGSVSYALVQALNPEQRAMVAFDFLMHDAHEAYLQDIISPIKLHLIGSFYRSAEGALDRKLAERFGFRSTANRDRGTDLVRELDLAMLSTEEQHFFGDQSTTAAPLPVAIQGWTAEHAERMFTRLFGELKPVAEAL